RPGRPRAEVAATLCQGGAGPADDRDQQDPQTPARAREVPCRPHRRRRAVRPRPGRGRLPPVRPGRRAGVARRLRRRRPRALLGPLTMDLSFSPEEEAFAAEVREWLAANLEPPPLFAGLDEEGGWGRRWQARLAEDRWVGIHWPREYGGRGAPPAQVAIRNTEY